MNGSLRVKRNQEKNILDKLLFLLIFFLYRTRSIEEIWTELTEEWNQL